MSEDKCCNTKVLLVTGGYDNSISLNRLESTEVKTCFGEIDKQKVSIICAFKSQFICLLLERLKVKL